jgi:hypothetical protein
MAFAVAYTTLAVAVASPAGTVTLAYPSGFTQAMFIGANALGTAYLLRNDNDRFEEADDEFDISYGASDFTVTNKTGLTWAIGDTLTINLLSSFNTVVPSTAGIQIASFPIQLVAMTTAAADLVTNYTPGFAFEILGFSFATTTLGTGASASQVLNLEIGTTNVTGGVLTLLLADTTPLGKVTAATAITAANTGTATDTISIEVAASGTVFTAGAGILLVKLRNLDTYNALTSMATTLARY